MRHPRYTEEEEAYLLDSYGEVSMMGMMRHLGRSQAAIRQKMLASEGTHDLTLLSGTFTTKQVADALGVTARTINDWVANRGLKAKRLNRTAGKKRFRQFLSADDVWAFVKANREAFAFGKVTTGILLPEPDWLADEVARAKRTPLKRPVNWTPQEDAQALSLDSQGVHYTDIALRLQRPAGGVWRRISLLRKRQREGRQKDGLASG